MKNNSYHTFAYYYNQLIPIAFYQDYANKINDNYQFNSILDLACGSGTLCFLLKDGFNEVTGLDLSEEMLMIALENNLALKKGISFIEADMVENVYAKENYDLVTCTLDSLNYLDSQTKLEKVFKNVYQALQKDGYFFFDVLTQFYIDEIVNDYYQSEQLADFEYEWHVAKIDAKKIKHDLNIFVEDQCFSEQHYQYIYDESLIDQLVKENGFEIVNKEYESNELDSSEASRIYYEIRKVG